MGNIQSPRRQRGLMTSASARRHQSALRQFIEPVESRTLLSAVPHSAIGGGYRGAAGRFAVFAHTHIALNAPRLSLHFTAFSYDAGAAPSPSLVSAPLIAVHGGRYNEVVVILPPQRDSGPQNRPSDTDGGYSEFPSRPAAHQRNDSRASETPGQVATPPVVSALSRTRGDSSENIATASTGSDLISAAAAAAPVSAVSSIGVDSNPSVVAPATGALAQPSFENPSGTGKTFMTAGTWMSDSVTLYVTALSADADVALIDAARAGAAAAAPIAQLPQMAANAAMHVAVDSLPVASGAVEIARLGSPLRLIADSVGAFIDESALVGSTSPAAAVAGRFHRAWAVTITVLAADVVLMTYHYRQRHRPYTAFGAERVTVRRVLPLRTSAESQLNDSIV